MSPDAGLHSWLWNAHKFLSFCFFALILLHLGAALFHALVRRDGVFEAMAPFPVHPSVDGRVVTKCAD
ncbi:Prokaryotic cytochrome b561 [compost metagenome]